MSWLKRLFAPRGTTAIASPVEPEQPRRVVVNRLILPEGIEAPIIEALQRGDEPDEKWTRKGRQRVYGAFFHKVVGESFNNPNGVSRQSILATAQVGTMVYFIPEPSNPADPEAIGVSYGQIIGPAVGPSRRLTMIVVPTGNYIRQY